MDYEERIKALKEENVKLKEKLQATKEHLKNIQHHSFDIEYQGPAAIRGRGNGKRQIRRIRLHVVWVLKYLFE